MTKEIKKVIEEVGAYYPGMVVASREQAQSQKGGISNFNNQTAKTAETQKRGQK